MWSLFWRCFAVIAPVMVFLIWVSCTVNFLYKHPQAPEVRIVMDWRTRGAVVMREASRSSPTEEPSIESNAAPSALTEATVHDFGVMNPSTFGKHQFVIHNRGNAPLQLRVGPTTCKCTVSGLAREKLPPGESTHATLEWHTSETAEYSHAAMIHTNDPVRKSIEFRVHGKIRTLIGMDVPEIVEQISPDQPLVVERLVYSQVWDAFDVAGLQTNVPGLQWDAVQVDPRSTQALAATAVQRLRLTIPGNLPSGTTQSTLRLAVRPSGEGQPQTLDIPFECTVLRRLSFYGPAIDSEGVIDLGDVREGRGARIKLLAKVRDANPHLPAAKIEVFPEFLKAELRPRADQHGLYDLTVSVPEQTPPCQYRSQPIGRIRIETGHDRIEPVELKVTFAIVPRPSL